MAMRDDGRFQQPESIDQYNRHEEQVELRQAAIGRYKRQQFELFELESDPGCPNCGEVGGDPIYGASYEASEQACTLCVRRAS